MAGKLGAGQAVFLLLSGFSTWLAWAPSQSRGSRTSHMVAGFSWDRCSKTPKLKLQGCTDLLSGVIQHLYHHILLVKREPEPAWVPGQRTTKEHESWEKRLFGVPSLEFSLEFSYRSLKVHEQACLLHLFSSSQKVR